MRGGESDRCSSHTTRLRHPRGLIIDSRRLKIDHYVRGLWEVGGRVPEWPRRQAE